MRLAMMAALAVSVWSQAALAQEADRSAGYIYDAKGEILRDSNGDCVRSIQWSFQNAVAECDPDAVMQGLSDAKTTAAGADVGLVTSERVVTDVLRAGDAFGFDQSTLSDDAKARLRDIAVVNRRFMISRIDVRAHTDELGAKEYNDKLAMERGEAVKGFLVAEGVAPEIVFIEAVGSAEPVVFCGGLTGDAQKECLAPNRRIEVAYRVPYIEGGLLFDLVEVKQTETEAGVKATAGYFDVSNRLNMLWRDIGNSCRQELGEKCGSVEIGEGRVMACLYEHYGALNPQCQQDLDAAQLYITSTVFKFREVARNCSIDIATTCEDTKPGSGGLVSCLVARQDQLQSDCQQTLASYNFIQ